MTKENFFYFGVNTYGTYVLYDIYVQDFFLGAKSLVFRRGHLSWRHRPASGDEDGAEGNKDGAANDNHGDNERDALRPRPREGEG